MVCVLRLHVFYFSNYNRDVLGVLRHCLYVHSHSTGPLSGRAVPTALPSFLLEFVDSIRRKTLLRLGPEFSLWSDLSASLAQYQCETGKFPKDGDCITHGRHNWALGRNPYRFWIFKLCYQCRKESLYVTESLLIQMFLRYLKWCRIWAIIFRNWGKGHKKGSLFSHILDFNMNVSVYDFFL